MIWILCLLHVLVIVKAVEVNHCFCGTSYTRLDISRMPLSLKFNTVALLNIPFLEDSDVLQLVLIDQNFFQLIQIDQNSL